MSTDFLLSKNKNSFKKVTLLTWATPACPHCVQASSRDTPSCHCSRHPILAEFFFVKYILSIADMVNMNQIQLTPVIIVTHFDSWKYLQAVHHQRSWLHHRYPSYVEKQSRQNARLFLQSSELGPPTPSPAGLYVPPPFGSGGGDTLACGCGRRGEGSQLGQRERNWRNCGTPWYRCTLWVEKCKTRLT